MPPTPKAKSKPRPARPKVTRLNLASGGFPLRGFVNLDEKTGWRFQDGLGDYADGSVAAITESHGIMYLPCEEWPSLFEECARVLKSGGVMRVTENWTDNPDSRRFGGRRPVKNAVPCPCPPTPKLVIDAMQAAGLDAKMVGVDETSYKDKTLIQNRHGDPPHTFHVEGVKP